MPRQSGLSLVFMCSFLLDDLIFARRQHHVERRLHLCQSAFLRGGRGISLPYADARDIAPCRNTELM